MEKVWISLLSVAGGALLGGVINALIGRYAAFKESQGVAGALSAEIGSLLELVKVRQYKPQLDQIVGRLSVSTNAPTTDDIFRARIKHDYFTVFNATCSRIGTLGPLASQVVYFYAVGKTFLEDVAELRELCERVTTSQAILDRATLLGISRAARHFLSWIETEGPQVVQRLNEYSARRWLQR